MSGGLTFWDLLLFSMQGMAQVLTFAVLGISMAAWKVVNEAGLSNISKLIYTLLLPCLMFQKLCGITGFVALWPMFCFPLVWVLIMSALSRLLCWGFGVSPASRAIVTCAACFHNAFALPYVVSLAIARSLGDSVGGPAVGETAANTAAAYVAVYSSVMSVLMWTIGLNTLKAAGGQAAKVGGGAGRRNSNSNSSNNPTDLELDTRPLRLGDREGEEEEGEEGEGYEAEEVEGAEERSGGGERGKKGKSGIGGWISSIEWYG